MATNLTAIHNATTILGFMQGVNTASADLFSIFILASIFMMGLLFLQRYGWDKGFVASSFITLMIGILFVFVGFMAFDKLIYIILTFIFSLFFVIWNIRS